MDDSLKSFVEHEALNQSWLAEQLWGSRESKYRTKLSRRLAGRNPWKPEEVEKLKKIRQNLFAEPSGKFTAEPNNHEEKETPDQFHYHEFLDRLTIVANMIDYTLTGHLIADAHPDWKAQAENAQEIILDLYKEVGRKHFNLEN